MESVKKDFPELFEGEKEKTSDFKKITMDLKKI